MKGKAILSMFAVIVVLSVWLVSPSMAQIKNTFVRLGSGVPGVLYEPVTPGANSEIAILVMHPRSDYLTQISGTELAKRGYRVLCANTSTSKSGFISDFDMDLMLSEVGLGVKYLRGYNKTYTGPHPIRKMVLLGHSGGGPLMSSYQNIAENGVSACQGPKQIVKCPDSLAGLPKADGLILLDSILGQGVITLLSLDPAVVSEENAQVLNPALDMYNLKNGFNPTGSKFTEKFKPFFFAKEKDRMNELIKKALDRLNKIKAGKGRYIDDEPFIVPGGGFRAPNNRLFTQDLSLFTHTRNRWLLLTKGGIKGPQIIYTVRVPQNTASPTPTLENGGLTTTVRRFLNTFAVRVTDGYGYDEDSITGIDYESNYNSAPSAVAGVTVPLLQLGMTGNYEFFMAETIFEHATKTPDKTLAYVEGATHVFTPCMACAVAQGLPETAYGDPKKPDEPGTIKTLFDYVDGWLSAGRF
jgi:hypothetical protein